MIIILNSAEAKALGPLSTVPPKFLPTLFSMAISLLEVGQVEPSPNSLVSLQDASNSISPKLQMKPDLVSLMISGLSHLLFECAKFRLSPSDFTSTLMTAFPSWASTPSSQTDETESVSKPSKLCTSLVSLYATKRTLLRYILSSTSTISSKKYPQFHSISWRFDINISRKSLLLAIEPNYILQLTTKHQQNGKYVYTVRTLSCSISELKILAQSVQEALDASKSAHPRRIFRYVK